MIGGRRCAFPPYSLLTIHHPDMAWAGGIDLGRDDGFKIGQDFILSNLCIFFTNLRKAHLAEKCSFISDTSMQGSLASRHMGPSGSWALPRAAANGITGPEGTRLTGTFR